MFGFSINLGGPPPPRAQPRGTVYAYGAAAPRQQRPINWMPPPKPIPGIPAGLEYLSALDAIVVNQCVEPIELVSNWESANSYSLQNRFGQQLYFAAEESGVYNRQMYGANRNFVIHVVDNGRREIMRIHRPLNTCMAPDQVTVECPPGAIAGTVSQRWNGFTPAFWIYNAAGQCVLTVPGGRGLGEQEYPIFNMQNQRVGAITKKWGGLAKELYTDADTFVVTFPQNLDCRMKAVLIGATFLLDFMAFEN